MFRQLSSSWHLLRWWLTFFYLFCYKGEDFPGLLGVVNAYLNSLDVEFEAKRQMRKYLNVVKRRADGERRDIPLYVCFRHRLTRVRIAYY